jgi:hypothetical protein
LPRLSLATAACTRRTPQSCLSTRSSNVELDEGEEQPREGVEPASSARGSSRRSSARGSSPALGHVPVARPRTQRAQRDGRLLRLIVEAAPQTD